MQTTYGKPKFEPAQILPGSLPRGLGTNVPIISGISNVSGLNSQIEQKMGRNSKLKGKIGATELKEVAVPARYKQNKKVFSPESVA